MPAMINVITVADAFEGVSAGTFRILRDSAPPTPLPVNYTVGGNATPGVEYTTLSGTATIPAFASYVDVGVSPINDATGRPPMLVVLTLASGTGYTIGSGSESPMTIFDNDNPTATADEFGGDEDDVITGNVLTNDTDPNSDPLTAAVLNGPWFGELVLNSNGSFTYTPPANFFGEDQFTYTVSDGTGGTAVGTVTITVDPVDDDPVIENQAFDIYENMPNGVIVGFVEAYDPDYDQTLTYSITAGNGAGVFGINSATGLLYIADNSALDYETTTSFVLTVQATDSGTSPRSETATVTINVLNLAEDEEETEAARIGWLNEVYDEIEIYFLGGEQGTRQVHGLSTELENATGWLALVHLDQMVQAAGEMQAAAEDESDGDSVAFRNAWNDYKVALVNFAEDMKRIRYYSGVIINDGIVMSIFSEGDTFRLEGISALMGTFNGYLDEIRDRIETAEDAAGDALAALQALQFPPLAAGTLQTGLLNFPIAIGQLNTLRSESQEYQVWAPEPDENSPGSESVEELNGIAELLVGAFGVIDLDNEESAVNFARSTAQAMYDMAVIMAASWQNPNNWPTLYDPALSFYLGDDYADPEELPWNNIGRRALTGLVWPLTEAYPELDQESGVYENYGAMGWILPATKAVYDSAFDALIFISTNLPLLDKLRVTGVDSFLAKAEQSLLRLRAVIIGGVAGQTPVEQNGLSTQLDDLLDAMGATTASFLLPLGPDLQALYAFVVNGGNNIKGISNYLDDLADLRDFIQS